MQILVLIVGDRKSGIPAFEVLAKFTVQRGCSRLQQGMSSFWRPLHLLLFHHPFGHDFVDRRLHKCSRNGF
jgi:hypothetical protein